MLELGILFLVGLLALIKGADWVVQGGSNIAQKLHIPPLIVGLTIISFGGSAPELFISISSATQGVSNITLNNIIGSNLINIMLVMGLSALIKPLKLEKNTVFKEIPLSFLAGFILLVLAVQPYLEGNTQVNPWTDFNSNIHYLGIASGLILLSFFAIFLYYTFGVAKKSFTKQHHQNNTSKTAQSFGLVKSTGLILIGFLALLLGSEVLVDSAIKLAQSLSLSENLIALTLISLGTSLPELVTSVVAAFKNQDSLAVGNIVGSNIFNIFLILGVSTFFTPIGISGYNVIDILSLVFITGFLFISIFIFKHYELGRLEGLMFVSLYVLYFSGVLIRG